MSEFPTSIPSIPRITSPTTQYMDDPGFEIDLLHNQLADEVEALAIKVGVTGSSVSGTVEKRITDSQSSLTAHIGSTSNPHSTTKSQVGLGNCDNTSDANKPVSTAQAAAISAAQAAAIAGAPVQSVAGRTGAITLSTSDVSGFTSAAASAAPVQSVAGRTGAVTLSTSDVSGFTSAAASAAPVQSVAGRTGAVTLSTSDVSGFNAAALAACPAETAATIGSLIAAQSTKAAIALTDRFALADSAGGNALKGELFSDVVAALYKIGLPHTLFQCGIPFVMFAGDGGANGLSFTGTRGQFTLSAAILSGVYAMLSGFYAYIPAGAGGLSAGWYWGTMSDDTHGEIFADTFTPSPGATPPYVASPTNNPNLTAGRITQTTSDVTASSFTNPGGAMGNTGILRFLWKQVGSNSANAKRASFKMSGSLMAHMNFATSNLDTDKECVVQNVGRQDRQIATRKNEGIGANNTSYSSDHSSIDTSVDQTITVTLGLTSNTDSMVMIPRLVTVQYGA